MLTVFMYIRYRGWYNVNMAIDYKLYRIDRQCLKKKRLLTHAISCNLPP